MVLSTTDCLEKVAINVAKQGSNSGLNWWIFGPKLPNYRPKFSRGSGGDRQCKKYFFYQIQPFYFKSSLALTLTRSLAGYSILVPIPAPLA